MKGAPKNWKTFVKERQAPSCANCKMIDGCRQRLERGKWKKDLATMAGHVKKGWVPMELGLVYKVQKDE